MATGTILIAGNGAAMEYAKEALEQLGHETTDVPGSNITHLLFPVPTILSKTPTALLGKLPEDIAVIGGNLTDPAFASYRKIDLLQDSEYLAKNARITAWCALTLAMNSLPGVLEGVRCLVIGWGRIGKGLVQLLRNNSVKVTVAARKERDRAALMALGLDAIDIGQIQPQDYALIFNTAPEMILPVCSGDACKIDLASRQGLGGEDVIWARGLPGKLAPKSAGHLIAQRIHALLQEEGL